MCIVYMHMHMYITHMYMSYGGHLGPPARPQMSALRRFVALRMMPWRDRLSGLYLREKRRSPAENCWTRREGGRGGGGREGGGGGGGGEVEGGREGGKSDNDMHVHVYTCMCTW